MLVAIALIQGNLMDQVRRQMPDRAPAFFFIDILPHQAERFDAAVSEAGGATRTTRMPMVRARIVKLNGVPAAEAAVHPDARWATRSERGAHLCRGDAGRLPAGRRAMVAAGHIAARRRSRSMPNWPAAWDLAVGDTITFNRAGPGDQPRESPTCAGCSGARSA